MQVECVWPPPANPQPKPNMSAAASPETQASQKADDETLIGHARLLYDRQTSQAEILYQTSAIKIATVERDQSHLGYANAPLLAKFVFYGPVGPCKVAVIDKSNTLIPCSVLATVLENNERYVSIRIDMNNYYVATPPNTTELMLTFHRKA
jgi:hypothetical protein